MTIHFFTFSDRNQPSSRQRTFYTAEALRRRGFTVVTHEPTVLSIALTPWPRKARLIAQVIHALVSIRKGDVIYLQRATYSKYFVAIMACYLALFRRKMIFDFDDPIYVHSYAKTKLFSRMADAVIVSTHRQLEWARQFNHNAHLIHFAIDPNPYKRLEKDYSTAPAGTSVVGWMGTGPEHMANLPLLVPVLGRLAAQRPFTFLLVGTMGDKRVEKLFTDIPGLDARFIERFTYTDPDAAPKILRTFDIGVVPHQSEGEWNRGKTSMKVLEYMACGVATVASRFGEMPYIIEDGVNGFLAATEDEWVEKLTKLLDNHSLCERLGRAGQTTVADGYSLEGAVSKVAQVIRSI